MSETEAPGSGESEYRGTSTITRRIAAALIGIALVAGTGLGVALGITAFRPDPEVVVETKTVTEEVVEEVDNPELLDRIADLEAELATVEEENAPDQPSDEGLFAVGDSITLTRDGEEASTLIIGNVEEFRTAQRSYGESPKNDRFVVINVEVVGITSNEVHGFDFYVVDESGNRYDWDSGNAGDGLADFNEFVDINVNAGERATGKVSFDVPDGDLILHYAPNYHSGPIVSWKL